MYSVRSIPSVKFILTASSALFLLGCANSYEPMAEFKGSAFNKYLSQAYAALSKAEYAEADYADADYFMNKSKMAAMGNDVTATELNDRTLMGKTKIQGMLARAKMINLLNNRNAAAVHPGPAAKLQVAYDCYLQELEENIQPADITACKDEFDNQVARLEELMKPAPKMVAAAAEPEVAPIAVPGPFNIYFGFDSAEISVGNRLVINNIASSAAKAEVTRIKIHGHADSSGDTAYNSKLGLKRAMAVQRALREAGMSIPMGVTTEGEENLQVQSGDGKQERLNRRVELVLTR